MRIAFNPSTVAALTSPPNNKDITFDLKGHNIFARGVEFKGTDTNTWRPVVDSLTSDSTTSSLSAKQGKVLKALIDGKSNSGHTHDDRYLKLTGGTLTGNLTGTSALFSGRFYNSGDDEGIIIKPASNGYAGLTLGTHDGERSVFYFTKGNPFWRYNNGTNNLDIKHPKKAGTIALTSDIPTKGSWNYDDRYLRLSGGTMTSDALITFADSGSGGTDKGPQGARGGLKWSGQSDYAKLYAEETARDNLDLVIQFGDDNSNGLSIRNKSNIQTSYISANGVITTSTFKGNLDWSYITNKPSTFTPAAHTHTWASITDKLVAGNEFNIVNAGFNGGVWFNYLPINDGNKTATVQGYHFGNGAKGYTNIKAAGFIKNGSNSSYVLLGDGGHKTISSLSVNYANSAGSATKVIVNQHTGNNTNYPLVWSSQANTSNVTENQLFKSWADLYYNPKNKRLTVGGSVVSSSFVKSGGTSQQLLRADGGVAAFNWSGQSGQPTWLWGGNDFNSYYVYNPSNFRVAYAASAGNADTLDGEHASNFVRAGAIEAGDGDLNALDTYSFIKSVNSKVASHSPKSATGWYNIIQAVHRNGQADGASYIGQIALGMTTNLSAMFYRTKHRGSWYAWNEVVTTNTGLLRYSRNNVNISSPNCSPIPPSLLEWTVGYPRLYDPEFNEGDNKVWVYNNAGNGVVTVTRVHDTNVGNSSSYVMKVVSASGASPNYGGWCVPTQTELGKVYTCLFRASIPSGVEIEWDSNSIGSGGQMSWLTNNMGTGKWTWYAVQVYCGSGGSDTFYFSAKSPCTWYLSYVNVIENNRASYAGLRSVYSDYLKQNASIVFGRNELQYFNQCTGVTAGATNNANPKTNWYHILRMNHANNNGYFVDLAIPFFDNKIQFRRITNGSDNGWRRVITEEPNHDVILREASTDGNVGIGINNPAYKLDVNGQMRAEGFHHWTVNSDNYILLAGGGYKSFGGDNSNPIFLGYLDLYHGNDGTISSSFSCLGYSVPFTYTRGGNYCRIYIPDTTHQVFYIGAATASVHYSGGGMDTWTGVHRGSGAWWLHCYAEGTNEVRVKGFCQNNNNNDSWWGGNPLWSGNNGANKITVCIFGYVEFR